MDNILAPKHLEMHRWILSTVATDVLVLKHQTISTLNVDQICIARVNKSYNLVLTHNQIFPVWTWFLIIFFVIAFTVFFHW